MKDDPTVAPAAATLAALQVIDRLAIGPVRLETKRLVAPYRLQTGERSHSVDLIYSFEAPVFDPQDPGALNLAAMMAAQVALNYGLFCREIVFHGPYDALDRRFLRTMAENTAREIYVKKFLEPNPFLVGDAARLPAVKRKTYLQARLRFSDRRGMRRDAWTPWQTERGRCAILSSGGKDSLLSFGLMRDVGAARGDAVHPLFVNESGRHWFTALNAYRHFREKVPNTARVWVNSDRLFNWMLRHLPFIRRDFADVRADEYPIRLWTVAVFLFGVLPLMRKRGIGRLTVTPNDVHAGEVETSTSLAARPHLVRMDRAREEVPAFSNRYLDFSSRRGVSWYAYTHKISASGVMGDPARASAAKGRRIWDVMVAHLVALVEDLKQMSLDEIHHRRY